MSTPNRRQLQCILYVEDDDAIRTVGRMVLESIGKFKVIECSSGAEALAKAPSAAADLILLDVMMPNMDGRETLARLRAIPATATTPAVFLTALVRPADIAELRKLGAAGVLGKPFNSTTLSDELRKIWTRCTD